jgi:CRISPR-associated protein Cas1
MIKKTLYFGNPAYLSLRNSQMVMRLPQVEKNDTLSTTFKKEAERTFPIEDLGVIILDDKRITVTQGLLERLAKNNCAVITCDSTHHPTGLLLPMEGNTLLGERCRYQVECSKPLRKQLWQQTIQAKISNQAANLAHLVQVENRNMLAWARDVKSDDADNLEARAAAYYWKNIFPEIPNFVRGRFEEAPNNLLNYGYAILRAVVARSLVATGLLPSLGIHHHNRYNAYCLADDIMEPYRPIIDVVVRKMITSYDDIEDLTIEMKRDLLSIPTIDVCINGHTRPLMVAVDQTTTSLYKCYAGESKRLIYPKL